MDDPAVKTHVSLLKLRYLCTERSFKVREKLRKRLYAFERSKFVYDHYDHDIYNLDY